MKYTLDQAVVLLMSGKAMKNGTKEYKLDGTQINALRSAVSRQKSQKVPTARAVFQAIDKNRQQWMADWELGQGESAPEDRSDPILKGEAKPFLHKKDIEQMAKKDKEAAQQYFQDVKDGKIKLEQAEGESEDSFNKRVKFHEKEIEKRFGGKTKGKGKGDMEASHGPAGEETHQIPGADVPQEDGDNKLG